MIRSGARCRGGQLFLCCCVAALAATPSFAWAAEGDIIVTASRTLEPDEATEVTVIERDTIELLQPISAVELLDRLAGVRAFERGGVGGPTYLSIRGGEPNFTLVLLEGIRLNNPTNSRGGAFDFSQIDPAALQQMQVARGALSAVHGADALAGVVNLQLRDLADGERLLSATAFADTDGGRGTTATAGTAGDVGTCLPAPDGSTAAASIVEANSIAGSSMPMQAGTPARFSSPPSRFTRGPTGERSRKTAAGRGWRSIANSRIATPH